MAEDDSETPQVQAAEAPATAKSKRLTTNRKGVVSQLWRAAKRQLDTHEEHLADLPKGAAASEADAKALATLARTVRELVAIEEPQGGRRERQTDELSPADRLRHVAQLRQDLARRLEALAAEEEGQITPDHPADGVA